MDLDDLKRTYICTKCLRLFYTDEEIYLVSQRKCLNCKEEN